MKEFIAVFCRIEGNKDVIIASRLKTFTHTLVPAGKSSEQWPMISAISAEDIAGRTAAELASAYIMMLRWPKLRTKAEVILWLDNCGYQNKKLYLTIYPHSVGKWPKFVFQPDVFFCNRPHIYVG